MKPMTVRDYDALSVRVLFVRAALTALRSAAATGVTADEDLDVAVARLENWLVDNERRWVA